MTEEKHNEITRRIEELKKAKIRVRKYTSEPAVEVECVIAKTTITEIGEDIIDPKTNKPHPLSARTYCLLKEVNTDGVSDIEFENHPFDLKEVYRAYKNNDFIIYNPQKKRVIMKSI
ncbi:MAG: hypothetical protein J6K33_07510 [Alistipes sp.]|nr:hypothetical protein [Alistipes sp.]MBP3643488.1 hypothetical protein [Alistipes sp.]